MKYESFKDGTRDVGKSATPEMVSVRVSSGSRRDAHSPPIVHYESYSDEYNALVIEKRKLESQLTLYSKAAYMKAQQGIRKQYRHNSLQMWIDKRAEMDSERSKLVHKVNEVQDRMIQIKSRVSAEKSDEYKSQKDREDTAMHDMMRELIGEVRLMRELLEEQIATTKEPR